jgi:hypothetical protein
MNTYTTKNLFIRAGFFFGAPIQFSVEKPSRYRLYLLRPEGLQEDIGSIGSRIDM